MGSVACQQVVVQRNEGNSCRRYRAQCHGQVSSAESAHEQGRGRGSSKLIPTARNPSTK